MNAQTLTDLSAHLRTLCSIIIVVFLLAGKVNCDNEWTLANSVSEEATVMILRSLDGGVVSFGTGVILNDSTVVTVSHNLGDGVITIVKNDEIRGAVLIDSVSGVDGLAILRVAHKFSLPAITICEPVLFSEVMIKGHTFGFDYLVVIERIVRIRSWPARNYPVWYIQGNINRGMSGSGVWNKAGELVGITWGYATSEDIRLACFLSAIHIRKLVKNEK